MKSIVRSAVALAALLCIGAPALACTLHNSGCPEAPAPNLYTVQHPNFFSGYAAQSVGVTNYHGVASQQPAGGRYASRPSFDVAAVDYAVGPNLSTLPSGQKTLYPVTQATAANWGSHCSLNRTTWNVSCGGDLGAGITINGVDFSAGTNAAGLSGATLTIANVTGPCVIKNSVIRWGPAATSQTSAGGWLFHPAGCSSMTILNSIFDGVGDVWALHSQGGAQTLAMIQTLKGGSLTVKYTAFLHCPARCFQWGSAAGANSGNYDVENSYFEGYGYCPPSLNCYHDEYFFVSAPNANNEVIPMGAFKFNTFLELSTTDGPNNADIVPSTGTSCTGCVTNNFLFDRNVIVSNIGSGGYDSGNAIVNFVGAWNNISFTNNWVDPTGKRFCLFSQGFTATGTVSFAGNVDLINGSAVTNWDQTASACKGVTP